MILPPFRNWLRNDIGFDEVEDVLSLDVLSAGALPGAEGVRRGAGRAVDVASRTTEIAADTRAGRGGGSYSGNAFTAARGGAGGFGGGGGDAEEAPCRAVGPVSGHSPDTVNRHRR